MDILTSATVEIRFIYDNNVLVIRWLDKPSMQVFKHAYLQILESIGDNISFSLFCTDLSLIGALTQEQEAWLMMEYYPKVYSIVQSDIHGAVVFSEDHFKAIVSNYQVNTQPLQQHFINMNYFTVYQEAIDWLMSIKKDQHDLALPGYADLF